MSTNAQNVYQMYVSNGDQAGFCVVRHSWSRTYAVVRSIAGHSSGPLSGKPPYFANPVVVADIHDLNTGRLKDRDVELPCAGNYTYTLIANPFPNATRKTKTGASASTKDRAWPKADVQGASQQAPSKQSLPVYEMYVANGHKAGFCIWRSALPKLFARVLSIGGQTRGRLPGVAPHFENAVVLVDVCKLADGSIHKASTSLAHPGSLDYHLIDDPFPEPTGLTD